MSFKRKILVAVIAAIALVGVGTGIVLAGATDDDEPLRGSTYDRATEAALDHVGGGTVLETENEAGDDGAAYSVEIREDGGNVVEVNLDKDLKVIGSQNDDDDSEGNETEEDDEDADD